MVTTKAVLAQARTALQRNRKQLQTELDPVERALAALKGVGGRAGGTTRRTRKKSTASPKLLAALKKARAARKQKLAQKKAAAKAGE